MSQIEYQNTIETPVSLEGKGLHKGTPARITFRPAEENAGIYFRRVDLPQQPIIPARLDQVSGVMRGTTLGRNGSAVHTVEHVLSAVYGLGFDNMCIDLDGEEPPACDGSAKLFVEALAKAGKKYFSSPTKICRLLESFWVEDGDRSLVYIPSDQLEISFTVQYPSPAIPLQTRRLIIQEDSYQTEVCFARTFGFMHEYEMLQSQKLALGGSLENAVVIDDQGKVMNPEGVRHEQEFVLHKILDLIGDLALSGRRLRGHFVAHKTGHALNVKFAKMLCERLQQQEEKEKPVMMNIEQIKEVLPHRYPFLLVDRILSLDPGKSIVGMKNVTANEEFFNGHFPGKPVMPGVLLVEAMAQVAGVLFLSQPEHKGKLPYFVGVDKVRFRKQVIPGDRLEFSVKVLKVRGNTGKVEVEARVDSGLVASGELMFTIL